MNPLKMERLKIQIIFDFLSDVLNTEIEITKDYLEKTKSNLLNRLNQIDMELKKNE